MKDDRMIEEQERDFEQGFLIAQALTRPKPHRNLSSDHKWNAYTYVCADCGITIKDFHMVPYGVGLPCRLIVDILKVAP